MLVPLAAIVARLDGLPVLREDVLLSLLLATGAVLDVAKHRQTVSVYRPLHGRVPLVVSPHLLVMGLLTRRLPTPMKREE